MSERYFQIGDLVFAVANESVRALGEILWRKLAFAECEAPSAPVAARFVFRDRLEAPGEPVVRLGAFSVGRNSLTLRNRSRQKMLFYRDRNGVTTVEMCENRGAGMKELAYRINKKWKYHIRYGSDIETVAAKGFLIMPMLPVLFMRALDFDMTFIHCSAVVRNGRALMFPAWGGVGKTSLLSHFVKNGWKYLCDDLAGVTADGRLRHIPLPMHIYKYHSLVCPDMTERMEQGMTPAELNLWRRAAHWVAPDKLVRWVEPTRVWGAENIVREAPLFTVIHMQRDNGRGEIELTESSAAAVARQTTSTIVNELKSLPALASYPNAVSGTDVLPDLGTTLARAESITRRAFAEIPVFNMRLPGKVTPEATYEMLEKRFNF